MDVGAFGSSEKRCCGWVVVYEEVGCECDDDGEESFLDEHQWQTSAFKSQALGHTKMKIHLHPF